MGIFNRDGGEGQHKLVPFYPTNMFNRIRSKIRTWLKGNGRDVKYEEMASVGNTDEFSSKLYEGANELIGYGEELITKEDAKLHIQSYMDSLRKINKSATLLYKGHIPLPGPLENLAISNLVEALKEYTVETHDLPERGENNEDKAADVFAEEKNGIFINENQIASIPYDSDKIPLEDGTYVSTKDVRAALTNYLIDIHQYPVRRPIPPYIPKDEPEEKPMTPEERKREEERRNKRIKQVKKKTAKALLPIILALGGCAALCFDEINEVTPITQTYTEDYAKTYGSKIVPEEVPAVKLGDTITLDKAIQIDATSQGGAPHGTLQPGEYNIQYVSVLDKSNNKILKVAYNSGEDIEEFVNKVAQDNNLTPDQVKYVLHLSNDSHALGWAGQENFDLNQETKFKTTEKQYTHESPISLTGDFNPIPGSNVTVNKKDAHSGMVLMDENGDLFKINQVHYLDKEVTVKGYKVDKLITFSLDNLDKGLAAELLALGFATSAALTLTGNEKKDDDDKKKKAKNKDDDHDEI